MIMDIERTIRNLRNNRFDVTVFENSKEASEYLKSNLKGTVGTGMSVTIRDMGIYDWLYEGHEGITFYDRFHSENMHDELRKSLTADIFLTGANAITEDGMLYNVDGTGNRVAGLTYGPKKVYVVAGINKIVKNLEEAVKRVEETAAPLNCERLNKKAPCLISGRCVHCNFSETICSSYVVTRRSHVEHRIEVILIKDNLGY